MAGGSSHVAVAVERYLVGAQDMVVLPDLDMAAPCDQAMLAVIADGISLEGDWLVSRDRSSLAAGQGECRLRPAGRDQEQAKPHGNAQRQDLAAAACGGMRGTRCGTYKRAAHQP